MGRGLSLRRFRCTGCGNCCRDLRVPLTDADLARLIAASGEPAHELIEWLPPDAVDMAGEPSSFVELASGRRVMVLAQRDGACRFLTSDRCSVWPARPRSCRLYPLDPSFGRRSGIRRLRVLTAGVDCRYTLDGEVPLSALRQDDAELKRELCDFHQLLERWNRAQLRRRRLMRRLLGAEEFLATLELDPERAA